MKRKMDGIVYIVGNFGFPKKNAAGKYNLAYAQILKEMGFCTVLIGTDPEIKYDSDIDATAREDYGFINYRMPYPSRITDWGRFLSQYRRVLRVFNGHSLQDIRAIIVFGSPAFAFWSYLMRRWAQKKGIPFMAHCAEWTRFTKRGFLYSIIRGLDEIYQKRFVLTHSNGLIVGGPLLRDYYAGKGCSVIVMPTMTDTSEHAEYVESVLLGTAYKPEESARRKRFIYVGVPFDINGNQKSMDFKDRLDKTIELFANVYEANTNFSFDIYGLTKEQYLRMIPQHTSVLAKLKKNVSFNGRVPHDEAIKYIANSDFFIFHRDSTKITEAAFPTKVSEAISLGVPVVTTKTSTIFEYLEDGKSGFVLDGENQEDVVLNLMALSNEDVLHLRRYCFESRIFDYRVQAPRFRAFFGNVIDSFKGDRSL